MINGATLLSVINRGGPLGNPEQKRRFRAGKINHRTKWWNLQQPMDWFRGKLKPENPIKNGENHGFP